MHTPKTGVGATKLSELSINTQGYFKTDIATVATALNKTAAADGALYLRALQDEYISVVCNHTNLTATNLNLFCDHANIPSAKIKAILDTAGVTAASQLGAMLEGTQLSLANAADVCENKYTATQKANAFDNAIMSAARITDIYNHTTLTIQKGQEIMDAQATPEKSTIEAVQVGPNTATAGGANTLSDTGEFVGEDWTNFILVITANTGAGQYRIISSNTDDILTVSANWDTNPDNTSAYEIHSYRLGFFGDDWDDNKLTPARDNAATIATSLPKIFQHFRPVWTVSANVSAAGGTMIFANAAAVKTAEIPSTFVVGTWEIDAKKSATYNDYFYFKFMYKDATHGYRIDFDIDASKNFRLAENDNGWAVIINNTWNGDTNSHTIKATRDVSGNFEIFDDGVSKGTVLDNTTTTSTKLHLTSQVVSTGGITTLDDLKVY